MAKAKWLMWIGPSSTILHATQERSEIVTACGLRAQLTGPHGIPLPPGKYTHCNACRRLVGD